MLLARGRKFDYSTCGHNDTNSRLVLNSKAYDELDRYLSHDFVKTNIKRIINNDIGVFGNGIKVRLTSYLNKPDPSTTCYLITYSILSDKFILETLSVRTTLKLNSVGDIISIATQPCNYRNSTITKDGKEYNCKLRNSNQGTVIRNGEIRTK